MTKQINTKKPWLIGLIALVVGILTAVYSQAFTTFAVKVIGLTVSAMGLIEVISALSAQRKDNKPYRASMYVAIVAVIAGVVIFFNTRVLVDFLMFLIGALVILLAIFQIVGLAHYRKMGAKFSIYFYLFSVLLLTSGVVMLLFPLETNDWIVKFAGVWIAAFGLSEIIGVTSIKVPEAVVVEDEKPSAKKLK